MCTFGNDSIYYSKLAKRTWLKAREELPDDYIKATKLINCLNDLLSLDYSISLFE
jgi:hypothetical protein